jgi:hypothetical protein
MYPRFKKFEDSLKYSYVVCEIQDCENEASTLAITETRYVEFCKEHHEIYILGEK